MTPPHTQPKQGNASPICFPNSWYIFHSVIHSPTHKHTQTHSALIIIQIYPWTGLKFIRWGCTESLADIGREVTLHCKHALSAYSFIYYALPSPLSLSAIGVGVFVWWRWTRFRQCLCCQFRNILDDGYDCIYFSGNYSLEKSITLFEDQLEFYVYIYLFCIHPCSRWTQSFPVDYSISVPGIDPACCLIFRKSISTDSLAIELQRTHTPH